MRDITYTGYEKIVTLRLHWTGEKRGKLKSKRLQVKILGRLFENSSERRIEKKSKTIIFKFISKERGWLTMEYGVGTISIGKDRGTTQFLADMNVSMDIPDNKLASDFVAQHYDELTLYVRKTLKGKIADPCELVHNVWLSFRRSEEAGDGYDPNRGNEDIITLEQFVYGRLKKYCLGIKFQNMGALERNVDSIDIAFAGDSPSSSKVDSRGVVKNPYAVREIAASSSEDLEFVYSNAEDLSAVEQYQRVEDFESIRDSIETLFTYSTDKRDMETFLRNLTKIGSSNVAISALRSMFRDIVEFAQKNSGFKETLFEVMEFAAKYPDDYKVTLASI